MDEFDVHHLRPILKHLRRGIKSEHGVVSAARGNRLANAFPKVWQDFPHNSSDGQVWHVYDRLDALDVLDNQPKSFAHVKVTATISLDPHSTDVYSLNLDLSYDHS